MTHINSFSNIQNTKSDNKSILARPEVLFNNFQAFSHDNILLPSKPAHQNNFRYEEKPDKSIIGIVGNLWEQTKNKAKSLVNSVSSSKKSVVQTRYKDAQGRPVKMTKETLYYFDKLVKNANEKGIKIQVNSSYRTVSEQTTLWNKALKKYGSLERARKWVAPPGHSRHNSGLAVDLNMYKNGKKLPQSQFDKVINESGFYRPMSWETWHIEPKSTAYGRSKGTLA